MGVKMRPKTGVKMRVKTGVKMRVETGVKMRVETGPINRPKRGPDSIGSIAIPIGFQYDNLNRKHPINDSSV